MLEIPESRTIAAQLQKTIQGKRIKEVIANQSPHKFAFYHDEPEGYGLLLNGRTVEEVTSFGGYVEISAEGMKLDFFDGTNIRYFEAGEKIPEKNQLFVLFEDGTKLICTVQMYGGIVAIREEENENPYYLAAKEKPSPLSDEFSEDYFHGIIKASKPNLSMKGLLATEQRIPGLGNGVLQDILFEAQVHPKTKIGTMTDKQKEVLFQSVKNTLREMTDKGGRDTEKDIWGKAGGYHSILSKNTYKDPCPKCGGNITRQAYMGGNVYFCEQCQPIQK